MRKTLMMSLVLFLGICGTVSAQRLALKNNIIYDAVRTPNLSLEMAMGDKWTLDTQVGMNFFFYPTDPTKPNYTTKKWSHWLVQPELRYWTCDVFNGWFVGLHGHGGQMNVGGINIPYFILQNKDNIMKNHRYEGYFYGGGLSLGYQWLLGNRFNLELSLGAGYTRFEYTKFNCASCGERLGKGGADYIGPTKATLSLVFFLK